MNELSHLVNNLPPQGVRVLMEASAKIPDAIHLEVGEPNFDTPEVIIEAAKTALESGFTHYTANLGLDSTRQAIADHLNAKYALALAHDNVAIMAGGVNALWISLLSIINRDDEVLLPDPSWPNYKMMLSMLGAQAKFYNLHQENGFQPDLRELSTQVSERTKAIIINSPGNPTGAIFDKALILDLVNFAKEHNLYIISDEVYNDIIFSGQHFTPLATDYKKIISIFSFSKSYAMTGWRVGYAVSHKDIVTAMGKLIEPVISCAPAFAQKATEVALKEGESFVQMMKECYQKRRDKVVAIFEENNIDVFSPQGAFYMMVDLKETGIASARLAFQLLEEEKVSVAPGDTFGETTKQMIRISLATDEEQLLEGVRRICRFIHKHKQ